MFLDFRPEVDRKLVEKEIKKVPERQRKFREFYLESCTDGKEEKERSKKEK